MTVNKHQLVTLYQQSTGAEKNLQFTQAGNP